MLVLISCVLSSTLFGATDLVPPLYIRTYDIILKDNVDIGTSLVKVMTNDYLQLSLLKDEGMDYFIGSKRTQEPIYTEDGTITMQSMVVTDSLGTVIKFTDKKDFFSYMKEHGYNKFNEGRSKDGLTEYFFKRNF